MKTLNKSLSVFLILAIVITSCLSGCERKSDALDAYKEIGAEQAVIRDSDDKPDHLHFYEPPDPGKDHSLQELLYSGNISSMDLLSSASVAGEIMTLGRITDVVRSRNEMEGLRKLRSDIKALLDSQRNETCSLSDAEVERLEQVEAKIGSLFDVSAQPSGNNLTYEGNLKGTWTTPDRIILRWNPLKEWIPRQGYNLFRKVNGNTQLIAQGLGKPES